MPQRMIIMVDNQKQEYLIDAFEIGYGLYEEADIAVLVHLHKQESLQESLQEAEGVSKPSSKGIFEEVFETVLLEKTLYNDKYNNMQKNYAFKFISEERDNLKFVEEFSLSTATYALKDVEKCLKELSKNEKELSKTYYLKVVKPPQIHFVNKDQLYITTVIKTYEEEI